MNHDPDWKLLLHYWNRLSPLQRQIIIYKAKLYRAEIALSLLIIRLFLFTARLIVPVPKKIQAHFL